jgi:hypothetical protein
VEVVIKSRVRMWGEEKLGARKGAPRRSVFVEEREITITITITVILKTRRQVD